MRFTPMTCNYHTHVGALPLERRDMLLDWKFKREETNSSISEEALHLWRQYRTKCTTRTPYLGVFLYRTLRLHTIQFSYSLTVTKYLFYYKMKMKYYQIWYNKLSQYCSKANIATFLLNIYFWNTWRFN